MASHGAAVKLPQDSADVPLEQRVSEHVTTASSPNKSAFTFEDCLPGQGGETQVWVFIPVLLLKAVQPQANHLASLSLPCLFGTTEGCQIQCSVNWTSDGDLPK